HAHVGGDAVHDEQVADVVRVGLAGGRCYEVVAVALEREVPGGGAGHDGDLAADHAHVGVEAQGRLRDHRFVAAEERRFGAQLASVPRGHDMEGLLAGRPAGQQKRECPLVDGLGRLAGLRGGGGGGHRGDRFAVPGGGERVAAGGDGEENEASGEHSPADYYLTA